MSGVVLGALEAKRTGRAWAVVAMCVAGVVGTWTLPQFGIAFVATGAVVLTDRRARRAAAIGLGVSIVAIAAWYAPHVGEVRASSQIEDGVRIGTAWLVTAPIDQVLLPALVWIDGTALVAGVVWLPLVVLAVLVMGSSPLVRDRHALLILGSGLVATVVVLWVARAYVIPRYLSYLLVPLFVLLATGAGSILGRITGAGPRSSERSCASPRSPSSPPTSRRSHPDVVGLPREAYKDAAEIIDRESSPTTPVFAYMRDRVGLAFYVEPRAVQPLEATDVARQVCGGEGPVVLRHAAVRPRGGRRAVSRRPGVEHHRIPSVRARRRDERLVRPAGELTRWWPLPALCSERQPNCLVSTSTCSPKPSGRRAAAGSPCPSPTRSAPRSSPPSTCPRRSRRSTRPTAGPPGHHDDLFGATLLCEGDRALASPHRASYRPRLVEYHSPSPIAVATTTTATRARRHRCETATSAAPPRSANAGAAMIR